MTMKLPAAVPSHAHPRWTAASACTPVGQCMGEGAPLPAKAESCVETTCHHAPSRPSPRSTARGPAAVAALCHAAAVAVGCKPEDLPDDQDLNHRLLHHSRPLFERLAVSIELAQPCRERITENGVVKEVHVIVKNVPFSIHVRLPAANEPASEDPAGAGVVDLRDADIEANLRYDGDGGRAVPFVQRAPLEIVASRVADDGQSAVLTARVRALSSQHQNRLFVVHVRIQVPSPGASSGHPPELMTQHHHQQQQQLTGLPVREALTEPVQVISKPRSSRKRVVRRKRTLGDMLLECTQRIERTQMSHLGAIGTLTKRCRLIPRGAAAGDAGGQAPAAARPVPSRLSYPAPSSSSSSSSSSSASSLAFPGGVTSSSSSSSSSSSFSSYADVGTAAFSASASASSASSSSAEVEVKQPDDPSWFFLAEGGTPLPEDPQLMMLMDLPAVALPTSSSMYSASSGIGSDLPADVPSTTTTTASTPGGMQMYAVPPASTAQSSSAGAEVEPLLEDQRQHQQHQHQHQHQHGEEDPMGRALIAFLTAYSALPTTDRSMAVRRALRRFGTDRLPALASLLAVVASRPRPKRPAEGAASFQSCVCTSCSFEAELQNIDGFYKDLINLEFSFQ